MQLSIIIVNYNVKYFLEQCLCSVIKACENIDAEIFVVDNYSDDGSEKYLVPKFPQVKFKWNSGNIGFGKASNSVLSETIGDKILFLNPDTILPEDCFEKCLYFFKQHQDCGALGVRMIDGSGQYLKESKRSFPSAMASFFKIAGFAKLFPRSKIFAAYYAGNLPEHKSNPVEVLAGAFMMLDKKMADKTKGFDESFFMYAEDIDLSYRIQKEGKKNYYFPETTIIHFKGESTQRLSKKYIQHFYGAMQQFVSKHNGNNKLTLFFTSMAISLNKTIALAMLFFKKTLSGNKRPQALSTAVIASQDIFNETLHLIKHATIPVIIAGRIATQENDDCDNIGNIAGLKNVIEEKAIRQLIFCEANISNKTAIDIIELLKSKTSFLFHAKGSDSIVGSNKKNSNGIFISRLNEAGLLQVHR